MAMFGLVAILAMILIGIMEVGLLHDDPFLFTGCKGCSCLVS